MLGRAGTLYSEVMAKAAFITPELLSLEDGVLEGYIADPDFADFDAVLSKTLRMKPHTLSAREEQLLAMAGEVCGASENAYDMLTDADMDLGKTRGEDGKVKIDPTMCNGCGLCKNYCKFGAIETVVR